MNDCLFCKIIKNEIPSYKVYEDENSIAFLDLFPTKRGQIVVIPKKHTESNFSEAQIDTITQTMTSAHNISKILEEKLPAERSFIVIQGMGVNHFHIKIYPKFKGDTEKLETKMGEKANEKNLELLQKTITK